MRTRAIAVLIASAFAVLGLAVHAQAVQDAERLQQITTPTSFTPPGPTP